MITILSPAKRLNFSDPILTKTCTVPGFVEESEKIMNKLKNLETEPTGLSIFFLRRREAI
jgi:cytoplasmic iron level regulating protein YaaA (DUF328/UPF0246 family)